MIPLHRSARPALVVLGSVLGGLAAIVWSWAGVSLLGAADDAGFRWPFPDLLALALTLLTVSALWLPWVPLMVRAGFRWWIAPVAGLLPPVMVVAAGIAGARLAAGVDGRARHDDSPSAAGRAEAGLRVTAAGGDEPS